MKLIYKVAGAAALAACSTTAVMACPPPLYHEPPPMPSPAPGYLPALNQFDVESGLLDRRRDAMQHGRELSMKMFKAAIPAEISETTDLYGWRINHLVEQLDLQMRVGESDVDYEKRMRPIVEAQAAATNAASQAVRAANAKTVELSRLANVSRAEAEKMALRDLQGYYFVQNKYVVLARVKATREKDTGGTVATFQPVKWLKGKGSNGTFKLTAEMTGGGACFGPQQSGHETAFLGVGEFAVFFSNSGVIEDKSIRQELPEDALLDAHLIAAVAQAKKR